MGPRLEGKSAIITGAGRGIGEAITRKFLVEGARVLMCDIVPERVTQAAQRLSAYGDVHAVAGDVSSAAFCQALVQQAHALFGELNVLVNNAGILVYKPFLEHTEADWERTMGVNLKGVFLLSQQAAQMMVDQGKGGVILSAASTNGHVAEKGVSAYDASKAGVVLLTKSMAVELGHYGIRANCVSPGSINSLGLARDGGVRDIDIEAAAQHIPLGRLGSVDDVANLYAFLASDEAAYITGESVIIDGGLLSEQ